MNCFIQTRNFGRVAVSLYKAVDIDGERKKGEGFSKNNAKIRVMARKNTY